MKFYYNDIILEVPKSVYYPREDSELMAKVIKGMKIKKALEVGCGSGFLSVLLAKENADVTSVDINPDAIEITKTNAKANGVTIKCFKSDLFENVKGRFDLIIFNPPYLPVEEGEDDIAYAGGGTGREVIQRFAKNVKAHLGKNGNVLLLISSLTGQEEVEKLFNNQHMDAEIIAREKIPWEELIVIRAS